MLLLICVEGLLYAGLSSLHVLSQWNLGLYEPKAHRGILEPSGIESPGTVCLSMVEDKTRDGQFIPLFTLYIVLPQM